MSSSKPSSAHRPSAVGRYLRSGVRSVAEVRAFLGRWGLPAEDIDAVIADCRRQGALDDQAYARLAAEHWARQGYAGRAIRERLAAKGVAEALVAEAIARLTSEEDDAGRAARLLSQPRWRRAGPGRRARWLAARGFDEELIERVVGTTDPE